MSLLWYCICVTMTLPLPARVADTVFAGVVDSEEQHDCEHADSEVETKVENKDNKTGHVITISTLAHDHPIIVTFRFF